MRDPKREEGDLRKMNRIGKLARKYEFNKKLFSSDVFRDRILKAKSDIAKISETGKMYYREDNDNGKVKVYKYDSTTDKG